MNIKKSVIILNSRRVIGRGACVAHSWYDHHIDGYYVR